MSLPPAALFPSPDLFHSPLIKSLVYWIVCDVLVVYCSRVKLEPKRRESRNVLDAFLLLMFWQTLQQYISGLLSDSLHGTTHGGFYPARRHSKHPVPNIVVTCLVASWVSRIVSGRTPADITFSALFVVVYVAFRPWTVLGDGTAQPLHGRIRRVLEAVPSEHEGDVRSVELFLGIF